MPLTHQEAERLVESIKSLIAPTVAPLRENFRIEPKGAPPAKDAARGKVPSKEALIPVIEGTGGAPASVHLSADVLEAIYREFKNRLLDDLRTDPIFLELLRVRPEIVVEIQPKVVTLDGSTLRGRLALLLAAGWFREARRVGTCRQELTRTGNDPGGGGSLGSALGDFVRDGFLTREGEAFIEAPGIKVSERLVASA